ENTIVTSTWNTQIIKELEAGKNVILTLPRGTLKADKGGDIQVGFSSIFWNTAWTNKQPPHTLGILCDPKHPALAQFPTDFHSDYQWWDVMTNCDAIVMDEFDPQLRPIVHIVDDWFTNRKLGLLFEGKVGNGKILVTSVDISSEKTKNSIVLNQFKNSIFDYVGSTNFVPQNSINPSLISNLLKK
ncbi:MAG: beta-galactosidase, partial [Tannerellaceae bacterium]